VGKKVTKKTHPEAKSGNGRGDFIVSVIVIAKALA
jgi:hypothetical protein